MLSRTLFLLESNSILFFCLASVHFNPSTLDQILFQSILERFNKSKPGSRTILDTIDFSKAFDSVWHPALFRKLFRLASFLALFDGFNLPFLTGALAWLFKITKVALFVSVEVFPSLALFYYFFISLIALLLYLST